MLLPSQTHRQLPLHPHSITRILLCGPQKMLLVVLRAHETPPPPDSPALRQKEGIFLSLFCYHSSYRQQDTHSHTHTSQNTLNLLGNP